MARERDVVSSHCDTGLHSGKLSTLARHIQLRQLVRRVAQQIEFGLSQLFPLELSNFVFDGAVLAARFVMLRIPVAGLLMAKETQLLEI